MKANTQTITQDSDAVVATISAYEQVGYDLKSAVLIVSVVANLFVVITWLALQVTSEYDVALASFFLGR